MAEATRKRCLLALDAAGGPLLIQVELAVDATVEGALSQARTAMRPDGPAAAIDWDGAAVGIWGQRCGRATVPRDGDRIEVYRSLPADPRERRRQRAARR